MEQGPSIDNENVGDLTPAQRARKAMDNLQKLRRLEIAMEDAAKLEIATRFVEKYPEYYFASEIAKSLEILTKVAPEDFVHGGKRLDPRKMADEMVKVIQRKLTPEQFEDLVKG